MQSPQYTERGVRRTWQRRTRARPGTRRAPTAGDIDVVSKLERLMELNPAGADVLDGVLSRMLERADERYEIAERIERR